MHIHYVRSVCFTALPRSADGVMKKWFVGALALLAANAAYASDSPNPTLESSGDALLVGLPIAALGLTFMLTTADDSAAGSNHSSHGFGSIGGFDFVHMTGSPRHDLGLALLRTEVVSLALKGAIDEERPNGNPHSFPSSHTSLTFSAAEFIRKEYGWGWGLPAFAAASYTGWTRLETDEHWWQDVAAGAVIGVMSNHDFSEFGRFSLRPALLGFTSRYSRHDQQVEGGVAPGLHIEAHF
jgi:membrane-associated phospholipid phosphatase